MSNIRFLDQVAISAFGATTGPTGSFLITASAAPFDPKLIFTKGDGSTFEVTVQATTFPYTGSAIITGSLDLIGPITITGSSDTSPFIISMPDADIENDALEVNSEGLLVLGNFLITPTAVTGGIFYSASSFYVGLD